jgi:23S rRNA pseudouridine1911/1915/1917 synthase
VHGDGRSQGDTLVNWLNEHYSELKEVGEEQTLQNREVIKRPGIVHRLDRDTSGVILVAKTKESHQFLKEQFQNRRVEKIYHAIVWGTFSEDKMSGIIDKPIGRSASDFRKWSAEFGAKGERREAVTEYKVLFPLPHPSPLLAKEREEEKKSESSDQKFSYLEVRPKTGRTHQIRVHLKSISHPVVCDRLYSNKTCIKEECLGFDRLALHALSIKLQLPNGMQITIESPLPLEFENTKYLLKKG